MKHKRSIVLIIILCTLLVTTVILVTLVLKKDNNHSVTNNLEKVEINYEYEVSDIEAIKINRQLDVREDLSVKARCYEDVISYINSCTFALDYDGGVNEDYWKYKLKVTSKGRTIEFIFYDGCCQIDGAKYLYSSTSEVGIEDIWMNVVESMDSLEIIMSYVDMLEKDFTYDEVIKIMGMPEKSTGSGIINTYYYCDEYEIEISYSGEIGIEITNMETGEKIPVPKKAGYFFKNNASLIEMVTIDDKRKGEHTVLDARYYDYIVEYLNNYTFCTDYFGEKDVDNWDCMYTVKSNGKTVELKFYDTYCLINDSRHTYKNSSEVRYDELLETMRGLSYEERFIESYYSISAMPCGSRYVADVVTKKKTPALGTDDIASQATFIEVSKIEGIKSCRE